MKRIRESGFTLTEMTLSLCIASVVGLAALSFAWSMMTASNELMGKKELVDALAEIDQELKVRTTCAANLSGIEVESLNTGAPVTDIAVYDASKTKVRSLIFVGQSLNGTKIEQLSIIQEGQIDATHFQVSLEILAMTQSGTSIRSRRLPVTVISAGGKIVDCLVTSDLSHGTMSDICSLSGQTYDEAENQCKARTLFWSYGSPTSAACPADQIPYPNLDLPCSCHPPTGWTDPKRVEAQFIEPDGTITTRPTGSWAPPWITNFDVTTGVCSCTYEVDIDSTGFRARIGCTEM